MADTEQVVADSGATPTAVADGDSAGVELTALAVAALGEVADVATVGPLVDAVEREPGIVDLEFACLLPGYPGWRWTVSTARLDGADPTVLEVELVPGDGALLAPPWVPWTERLAEYRRTHDGAAAADGEGDADDDGADADDLDDEDLDEAEDGADLDEDADDADDDADDEIDDDVDEFDDDVDVEAAAGLDEGDDADADADADADDADAEDDGAPDDDAVWHGEGD